MQEELSSPSLGSVDKKKSKDFYKMVLKNNMYKGPSFEEKKKDDDEN